MPTGADAHDARHVGLPVWWGQIPHFNSLFHLSDATALHLFSNIDGGKGDLCWARAGLVTAATALQSPLPARTWTPRASWHRCVAFIASPTFPLPRHVTYTLMPLPALSRRRGTVSSPGERRHVYLILTKGHREWAFTSIIHFLCLRFCFLCRDTIDFLLYREGQTLWTGPKEIS